MREASRAAKVASIAALCGRRGRVVVLESAGRSLHSAAVLAQEAAASARIGGTASGRRAEPFEWAFAPTVTLRPDRRHASVPPRDSANLPPLLPCFLDIPTNTPL